MSINNRLRDFRDFLRLNQTQMADSIGIERSTYTKYEKEGIKIPDYAIVVLKLKYNLNEPWLRENEGEMFNHSDYKEQNPEQIIEEPLLTKTNTKMTKELECLRQQVAELTATVRDQAASLRDYAAAEKDNARSRANLTDTVILQAHTIADLTNGKKLSKNAKASA
jgi:transcriptional regulator with XRE-family HTH domain